MLHTDRLLNFVSKPFEGIVRYFSPLAGASHALNHLVTTEFFGDSIALCHEKNGSFDSGEAGMALAAFPTAANRNALFYSARVNNARGIGAT